MVAFIKRSWLNISGAVDTAFSRIQKRPSTWAIGGVLGVIGGVVLGVVAGNIEQSDNDSWDDIVNDRNAWIQEVANYKPADVVASFPQSCGLGNDWYFAAKRPNGDYGLYIGSEGSYVPASANGIDTFVEKYEACMNGSRSFEEMRNGFRVDFNSYISDPLRFDNSVNEGDYSFIRLGNKESDAFEGSIEELAKDLGSIDKAYETVDEKWAPAIEAFKDGDIYNHKNDRSIATYNYEYKEPSFPLGTLFNFTVIGLLAGFGGVAFTGKPSEAFKERRKARNEKREYLDKLQGIDNMPF